MYLLIQAFKTRIIVMIFYLNDKKSKYVGEMCQ